MKKLLWLCMGLVLILAACGNSDVSQSGAAQAQDDGIKVGVLFSLSGNTAIVEESMANAALLAIDEINSTGGINGQKIIPIQEDYASEPADAATKIGKLILQDEVAAVFGGFTSASRQAMLPIVEQNNSILFYPTLYEGQEYSKNIIYGGALPNQQLEPNIEWIANTLGKKVFMVGNDYIYPVETNNQLKHMLKEYDGEFVGEEYVPHGETEFSSVINKIKKAKPDYVFLTLVGESAPAFYNQYYEYGINPKDTPIVSPAATEAELAGVSKEALEGNIGILPYFSTTNTIENEQFTKAYTDMYGEAPIFTMMESVYTSVYLFKQALEQLEEDYSTDNILDALIGQEFQAPQGLVKVHESNHMILQSSIAQLNAEGIFEIIQTYENIQPQPWSEHLFPDQEKPWMK